MMVEFTEQELAVISYGLEDHIVSLNRNINYIDELPYPLTRVTNELRKAHMQARTETKVLLAKVEGIIGGDY